MAVGPGQLCATLSREAGYGWFSPDDGLSNLDIEEERAKDPSLPAIDYDAVVAELGDCGMTGLAATNGLTVDENLELFPRRQRRCGRLPGHEGPNTMSAQLRLRPAVDERNRAISLLNWSLQSASATQHFLDLRVMWQSLRPHTPQPQSGYLPG